MSAKAREIEAGNRAARSDIILSPSSYRIRNCLVIDVGIFEMSISGSEEQALAVAYANQESIAASRIYNNYQARNLHKKRVSARVSQSVSSMRQSKEIMAYAEKIC